MEGIKSMFVTFDRMEMQKEVFKDYFRAIYIITGIIMTENGSDKHGRQVDNILRP